MRLRVFEIFLFARPARASLELKSGQSIPSRMSASTFAREYFGYWVVTTDPLLTSAKWVAYGTEVQVENLCKTHDFFMQGLCTGLDGSIVFCWDILCECWNARQRLSDISSPPVLLFLHLVGGSI